VSADRPGVVAEWIIGPARGSQAPANSDRFDALQAQIGRFQDLVANPDSSVLETTKAGRELFQVLFPPAVASAVRSAQRLIVSPDGMLWTVPFAALVEGVGDSQGYLGERVAVTYTQSLALLQQGRERSRQRAGSTAPTALVVGVSEFGVPDADRSRGVPPPRPLPHARQEAIAIASLLGTEPRLDRAATEAAVRRDLGSADIVHLATHGRLSDGNPMSSAVLLAASSSGAAEAGDNGALEAWEIFAQVRLKADLVVLSGCETARGEVTQGEGIVGLTRALQYAGATSIVASQWPVADTSTTAFMQVFHQGLRAGRPKDEALRSAMASLRSAPATRHPYYWAPFVVLGSPDNPWTVVGGRD
jgi:CHAT domain-containing protein